jgi:hypothetical protein
MAYPLRKDPENCLGKVHEDMHWIHYEVTTWAFYLKRLPALDRAPKDLQVCLRADLPG